MRIFERLRGRGRGKTNVERKLLETVTAEFLRGIEEDTEVTAFSVVTENKSVCCSCCSAEAAARQ